MTTRAPPRAFGNRSKNTGYLECDVTDPDGKRVAKATSTRMVLRGEQARRVKGTV